MSCHKNCLCCASLVPEPVIQPLMSIPTTKVHSVFLQSFYVAALISTLYHVFSFQPLLLCPFYSPLPRLLTSFSPCLFFVHLTPYFTVLTLISYTHPSLSFPFSFAPSVSKPLLPPHLFQLSYIPGPPSTWSHSSMAFFVL